MRTRHQTSQYRGRAQRRSGAIGWSSPPERSSTRRPDTSATRAFLRRATPSRSSTTPSSETIGLHRAHRSRREEERPLRSVGERSGTRLVRFRQGDLRSRRPIGQHTGALGGDARGTERAVLATPGGILLEDISRAGRVLLIQSNARIGFFGLLPGNRRNGTSRGSSGRTAAPVAGREIGDLSPSRATPGARGIPCTGASSTARRRCAWAKASDSRCLRTGSRF